MKKLYSFGLLLALSIGSSEAQIFVSQSGGTTKDGSSWQAAYDHTQLQQAINEASTSTMKEVWVAKGIYKPTESLSSTLILTSGAAVSDRDNAFILKPDVKIYGGFNGTESTLAERVLISTNESILSGDLNNNNIADDGDSYHVVASRNASLNSLLDGFTIKHGFANGTGSITEGGEVLSQETGAGIYLRGANTACTLSNLIIKDNESSAFAAGIFSRGSGANKAYNFNGILFENNIGGGSGGALYMYLTSATTVFNIKDCQFNNNSGKGDGGGALIASGLAGTTNIYNTRFTGNTHSTFGGAIRNGAGTMNIVNSTFRLNSSTRGAVYNTSSAKLNVDNCKFDQNSSSGSGGQIYVYTGTVNVQRSAFNNGVAASNGGAIFITSNGDGTVVATSTVTVSNSTFYNNVGTLGGAVYLSYGTNDNDERSATALTLLNNTFYANKCTGGTSTNDAGGAVYFASHSISSLNVYNCIFNKNLYGYDAVAQTGGSSSDFRRGQTAAKQYYYNNLVQASTNLTDNGNRYAKDNINNANPSLLFQSTTPTDANFLYPISGSVVIDKGDNTLYGADLATATDILGNTRLVDGTNNDVNDAVIDIGAIEWNTTLPVTVKSFTAALINNRVQFKWSVGVEDNVAKYLIEHSVNGTDFTPVSNIQASRAEAYSAIDARPQLGTNYYRLTSVDNDGTTSSFSKIATVKVSSLGGDRFSIYPNPVQSNIATIYIGSLPAGNYKYDILDVTGKALKTGIFERESQKLTIDLNVPSGTYIVRVTSAKNTFKTKLIKL